MTNFSRDSQRMPPSYFLDQFIPISVNWNNQKSHFPLFFPVTSKTYCSHLLGKSFFEQVWKIELVPRAHIDFFHQLYSWHDMDPALCSWPLVLPRGCFIGQNPFVIFSFGSSTFSTETFWFIPKSRIQSQLMGKHSRRQIKLVSWREVSLLALVPHRRWKYISAIYPFLD